MKRARMLIAAILLVPSLASGLPQAYAARRPVVTTTCVQEDGRRTCVISAVGEQSDRFVESETRLLCPDGAEVLLDERERDTRRRAVRCQLRVAGKP